MHTIAYHTIHKFANFEAYGLNINNLRLMSNIICKYVEINSGVPLEIRD